MSATILQSPSASSAPSNAARWTGRLLSGIAILFLVFDASLKLLLTKAAVEGSVTLGFTPQQIVVIGIIQVVCLLVYMVPRTAIIGAVLWTGYLGGAIVTHLRVGNPLFTHILFPTYVAALLWGGLYLRDRRVRALIAPTR